MNSQKHFSPPHRDSGGAPRGKFPGRKAGYMGLSLPHRQPEWGKQEQGGFPRGRETTSPPLHAHTHMHTFHRVRMPCEVIRSLSLGVCKRLVMILH